MSSEIIRDGSIAGGIPEIPAFGPASSTVFSARAERLVELAPGHALEEYLRFAGALSRAQDRLLRDYPEVALPDAEALARCREHGLPPLSIDGHTRNPVWREGLQRLLAGFERGALPPEGGRMLEGLERTPAEALEAAARDILAGAYAEVDAASAPFIAAALQVYWVKQASALGVRAFSPGVQYGHCPVCGSLPVASVVRIGGTRQGLRYLHCSLCESEWHVVRVKCTACASTKGISYFAIEGSNEAVKAEVCDQCKTYLKILHLEKDSRMEPGADDLATLALDMLVDEQGYNRLGPNLLLAVKGEG